MRSNDSMPVLLLDATSLVGRRTCFDELLRYPEDVVISAEPKRGCPPGVSFALGAVANTGVTLLRPGSMGFLRAMLFKQRGHYQHHCYEQEAFNAQLVEDGFTWHSFPYLGAVPQSASASASRRRGGTRHDGATIRFLNYSHWPRNYRKRSRRSTANLTWFSEDPALACLFHPWVMDKTQHIKIYTEAHRWYI